MRCHATPTACTELDRRGFRLDRWLDAGAVRGVASMTDRIAVRAVDQGDMPPDAPLPDRERELLRRWQRAGSPRGDGAAAPPTLALATAVPAGEPPDQLVPLAYDVREPDGDDVAWDVVWQRDGLEAPLVTGLPGGHGRVALDLGVLASGDYRLVARLRGELDDAPTDVPLGPIAIPDRDAAPSVALDVPSGGEQLLFAALPDARWRTDDVDTAGPLAATLSLRGADGVVHDVATGLDARLGRAPWSAPGLAPGAYDLLLTVSDGTAARTAQTGCPLTLR
ncbi:MAG TPA: hypothetical protein VHE35_03595 [Kofleriaceae bacterium]|nr:hypothetical protein [Kofleriaceae bacterium]